MEFQAVILAGGGGSRMTDLTTKMPKALLPVANMPMVWYPVTMLQKAGFHEAIIIVCQSHQENIRKSLVDIYQVKIQLDFVTIPDEEDWGTADSLRHIASKIKRDFLVVSCDLITDVSLHLLADLHRTNDATVTCLMAPIPDISESAVPGGKAYRKLEKDFVGLDEHGTRLLFLSSEADLEENITFRKSFLRDHPFIDLRSELLDSHLYLMKHWVVEFLQKENSITTIKGELLPKLVRKQFSSEFNDKTNNSTWDESIVDLSSAGDQFAQYASEMSIYSNNTAANSVKCFAYVVNEGFCMRTNNVLVYFEANKSVPRHLCCTSPDTPVQSVHASVQISKSTVGADSIVGEGSTIGERVAIKKSIIGRHCTIKDRVKVSNCVIMDYSTIEEGCILSGSVVCMNSEIGEKCDLKDTIVAVGQKVNPMGKYSGEAIVELYRMMQIEQNM